MTDEISLKISRWGKLDFWGKLRKKGGSEDWVWKPSLHSHVCLGLGPGFLEGALVKEGSREKAKQGCGPSWRLA